jgi:diguanylate cyclase (GGDEF)-like protein
MRKAFYDILLLVVLVAAAAALALTAALDPTSFPRLAGWVALLGFGITTLVVSGSFRGKAPSLPGLLPLIVGFVLLAGGVLAGLVPETARAVATTLTAGKMPAEAVPTLFHATGALGVALGFLFWTNGLVRRAVDAEHREVAAKSETEELEDVLRVQGRELEEALSVDPWTGVLNRRTFLQRVEESIQRDSRLRKPMALVLLEVVDLPADEVENWRPGDDTMLKIVAKALLSSTRGTDHVGRIADDRFAVVLGECEDPRPAVDRLLLTLEEGPTCGEDERKVRVRLGTVRIPQPTLVSTRELFQIADEAVGSLQGTKANLCAHRTYGERSTTSRVSTVT